MSFVRRWSAYEFQGVAAGALGATLVLLLGFIGERFGFGTTRLLGIDVERAIITGCATVAFLRCVPSVRPVVTTAFVAAWLLWVFESHGLLFIAFAALTAALARLRRGGAARHVVVIAVWAVVVALRWTTQLTEPSMAKSLVFAGLWVIQLYPALLLLEAKPSPPFLESVASLLFIGKFAEPFFQPVPPQRFMHGALSTQSLGSFASGVGLYVGGKLALHWSFALDVNALPVVVGWALYSFKLYGAGVGQIFSSVGLARVMGYQLHSGFHRPFLSVSFVDFYRRWNTYVREAVLLLLIRPYARKFGKPRTKFGLTALRFTAIAFGSYALNDLLVPLATSFTPAQTFANATQSLRLLGLAAWWVMTAIEGKPSRWARLRFSVFFLVVMTIGFFVQRP